MRSDREPLRLEYAGGAFETRWRLGDRSIKKIVCVLDDGELVEIYDPNSGSNCNGRSVAEYCGGCDQCLEMQADYAGLDLQVGFVERTGHDSTTNSI